MKSKAKLVVEKMFVAFSSGDVEKFAAIVSEDTAWIYHGTQIIPQGTFEKEEGVKAIFANVMERTEIINFESLQYIVEDNVVVVLGKEHEKAKRSGRELKQKGLQIYTVKNDLITKMEEFATSEEAK